ncbi:MAG: polysaccharide deacetylase family protein [Lewinellaceae bacterium]|nr:polysaccharide deacetylase family protein [Lewinellaceae bacterium]
MSDESPPHVRHLYPVRTERQFREDLDFLLKHFQPIDLQTLWEHVFEKRAFDRPVFHLTFDDGLRECYDVVLPILLEKGISATFFLNPDFIDNQGLMYRYKASLLSVAHLQGVPHFQNPLEVKYENRQQLDTWAEAIGLDFAAFLVDQNPTSALSKSRTCKQRVSHFEHTASTTRSTGKSLWRSKSGKRCRVFPK